MSPSLAEVRAELPALASEVYLNAGGAGPLPRAVAEAVEATMERDLRRGRMGIAAAEDAEAEVAMLRSDVGRLLGASGAEIAIANNTTAAQNAVIWGLPWSPGDEVVTTQTEHPGLSAPLHVLGRRFGVRVRAIPDVEVGADLAGAVRRRLGRRTRLVALSHVSWATGVVLDVAGAAAAAREAGALTLVDGAQSVGAIPVDPRELGVDAYALPAHKWLCGPEGLGALWVGEEAARRVELTFAGYESGSGHRADGGFAPHREARRHETSTPARALVPGWRAGIAWLSGMGWGWIYERIAEAQREARDALATIRGVSIVTPPGRQAGLVTFRVDGHEPETVSRELARAGINLRWLPHPSALRVSTGFYTDSPDIERLADGVRGAIG